MILRPSAPSGSTLTCSTRLAPKCASSRSVWSRLASASTTTVSPGRGQPGQQHRRLDLGGGHRRAIDDRHRVARAGERDRQPAAVGHAASRARRSARPDRECAASAACAGWRRRRRSRSPGSPRPPPSRGGSRCRNCRNRARTAGSRKPPTPTPWTRQAPSPVRSTLGAQRPHGFAGVDHVLAFEQPGNRVSPTVSAPKISARWEIDLSPGTRTRPASGRRAARGERGRDGVVHLRPRLAGNASYARGPEGVIRGPITAPGSGGRNRLGTCFGP